MRYFTRFTMIAAMLVACAAAAHATPSILDQWFSRATSFDKPGPVQKITTPDYMCGKTFESMCKSSFQYDVPGMLSFWELLKYDRAHQIGLAMSNTDQRGFALFKAPMPPGLTVPNADLSQFGTGRGLHIGSPYSEVLALYGPPNKHGQHFTTSYSADDTVYYKGKPQYFQGTLEKQSEIIVLVIDDGRVSSITINVELWEP
jgi:hypothetical protein